MTFSWNGRITPFICKAFDVPSQWVLNDIELHLQRKLSRALTFCFQSGSLSSGPRWDVKSSKRRRTKMKTWPPDCVSFFLALTASSLQSAHQSLPFPRFIFPCFTHPPLLRGSSSFVPIVLSRSLDGASRTLALPSSSAAPLGREVIGGWPSGLRASHSCVTSATSQPSTTGRRAPQPSDLWARCAVTSAVSATLTSRISHVGPPNIELPVQICVGFFELHHGYCVCSKCTLF